MVKWLFDKYKLILIYYQEVFIFKLSPIRSIKGYVEFIRGYS